MADAVARGAFIRGEVSSADASAGIAASLFDASRAAVVLAATDRIVIYDVIIVSNAGGNVALTVNTDAAGSRIIKGKPVAGGIIQLSFSRPVECPKGVVPKLFAAAGQIECSFIGEIIHS